MGTTDTDTATLSDSIGRKIGGPPRLFIGKTQITRSGQMTASGNALMDRERTRLSKELGFEKPLSIGCVMELFFTYVGENKITAAQARKIADKVNAATAEAAHAA